jgi:hypothetical protein
VGYGPFSLCVIHEECLCPSSGDINRLMMFKFFFLFFYNFIFFIFCFYFNIPSWCRGGQCTRSVIAEVKHLQKSVGWPKFYYLECLHGSEGTLSRWSHLHLQSLTPTLLPRSRLFDRDSSVRRSCRIFITR